MFFLTPSSSVAVRRRRVARWPWRARDDVRRVTGRLAGMNCGGGDRGGGDAPPPAPAIDGDVDDAAIYRSLEPDVEEYERRAREDVASLVALAVVERVIIDDDGRDAGARACTSASASTTHVMADPPKAPTANVPALACAGSRELMDLFPKARAKAPAPAAKTTAPSSTWAVNALHKQFNTALGAILDELVKLDVVDPFLIAVDVRNVPDYYVVIETPIDIATMRDKARGGKYLSKDAFANDLRLMESNAVKYNGSKSVVADMARAVVSRGEELLSHMPRVDFVTCARVAAFADALTREKDSVLSLDDDGITDAGYGEDDVDANVAAWREATMRTRVRRVFRAKALAGLPLGDRRAVRPRSARGMLDFMRASADHCFETESLANDATASIEVGARSAAPEDDIFIANAVPALPQYAGTALVMRDEDAFDAMTRAVARAWLERPQFEAGAIVTRGTLHVVASHAQDFITNIARAIKRATVDDAATITTGNTANTDADNERARKKQRTSAADDDAQLFAAVRVSRRLPQARRALRYAPTS